MGDAELAGMTRWRRRAIFVPVLVWLAGCSSSGPGEAEALQQIGERIRAGFGVGEKQLANLSYKNGLDLGDGRYAVAVQYDLIATMPEMGLFNTQVRPGQINHVSDERYVFVRSGGEWKLE